MHKVEGPLTYPRYLGGTVVISKPACDDAADVHESEWSASDTCETMVVTDVQCQKDHPVADWLESRDGGWSEPMEFDCRK